MHAHRKIELQPSARLAQTGLAGQHNETEQERRRGAALIHLSTYRAGDPRPFSCCCHCHFPANQPSDCRLPSCPFCPRTCFCRPRRFRPVRRRWLEQSTLRRGARPSGARCPSRIINPALSNRAIRGGRRRRWLQLQRCEEHEVGAVRLRTEVFCAARLRVTI